MISLKRLRLCSCSFRVSNQGFYRGRTFDNHSFLHCPMSITRWLSSATYILYVYTAITIQKFCNKNFFCNWLFLTYNFVLVLSVYFNSLTGLAKDFFLTLPKTIRSLRKWKCFFGHVLAFTKFESRLKTTSVRHLIKRRWNLQIRHGRKRVYHSFRHPTITQWPIFFHKLYPFRQGLISVHKLRTFFSSSRKWNVLPFYMNNNTMSVI